MKYVLGVFIMLLIFWANNISFAQSKIVDYFLENPNAWDDTKRIIRNEPVKVVVINGLEGMGFNLTELTEGDKVALVFMETGKAEKMEKKGFYYADGKLLMGKNRVVSVITRNYGDRTKFHYEFKLQRKTKDVTVKTYNNNRPVLESKYDGSLPIRDISDLSGITLCEIEILD